MHRHTRCVIFRVPKKYTLLKAMRFGVQIGLQNCSKQKCTTTCAVLLKIWGFKFKV